jgi:hypothetical protein
MIALRTVYAILIVIVYVVGDAYCQLLIYQYTTPHSNLLLAKSRRLLSGEYNRDGLRCIQTNPISDQKPFHRLHCISRYKHVLKVQQCIEGIYHIV